MLLTRTVVRDKLKLSRGSEFMKEMLHSKVMISFILFILGFTYVNSLQMNRLEEQSETTKEILYIP